MSTPGTSAEFTYSPEMQRLLARSALINHYYEDFDISFSSLFLDFLANDDTVSQWFQVYVKRARINIDKIMQERGLNQQIMGEIARSRLPEPYAYSMTTSALRFLQTADQFRQSLREQSIDVHHLMAVFIYRPWVHEKDLIRWGFNRKDWSNAFLEQIRLLRPKELDFWKEQHRSAFNDESDQSR